MIRSTPIILLLLLLPVWVTAQDERAGTLMTRARYQVAEKLYADALATLDNLPAGADQSQINLSAGLALSGLNRLDEANRLLMQVSGNREPEAYYQLARNYAALRDYPSAVRFLERHLQSPGHLPEKNIRLDPAFAELENSRDWVRLWQQEWYSPEEKVKAECEYLISRDQLDEAAEIAGEQLNSDPDDARSLLIMARVHQLRKAERLFKQTLDRAWQLSANEVGLREEMLRFALSFAYYEKVNTMATELIRKDPTNPEYLVTRALVRILDGQESQAVRELETLESAGITPAELYYQAGRKLSASVPLQAERYLTNAIGTGPLDDRYYFARANVRIALDKTRDALDDFAMSLDINPYQPDLYVERAQVRLDNGDSEGACHDWRKALEMGNAKAADQLYKHCRFP